MEMKDAEFCTLVKLMRGNLNKAASQAARLVLVHGSSQADASRETGATRSTVSLTVQRYADADKLIRNAYAQVL